MRLSLGIFAHNEERNIGATLESLFSQTLFDGAAARKLGVEALEVLCLANGCRDRTLEVARSYGLDLPPHVTYRVVDLPEPGKSRTWNAFVHELSAGNATFLVAMDADIIFEQDDVLEQLVRRLLDDPRAQVSTDTPLKALATDPASLSMADRASVAASSQASKEGVLCGQLYCARADILRKIWLPPALPVEDGFLGAMIKTSGFTSPDDFGRIGWVPTARHFFRTHRSVGGYLSHEARIIAGSVINSWLFGRLWEEGRKGHAGAFIAAQNRADPEWLHALVQAKVRVGGAWLVPAHFMLWRLQPLKGQPLSRKLRRAPIALAATALNLLACVRANAILKRENAAAHW